MDRDDLVELMARIAQEERDAFARTRIDVGAAGPFRTGTSAYGGRYVAKVAGVAARHEPVYGGNDF